MNEHRSNRNLDQNRSFENASYEQDQSYFREHHNLSGSSLTNSNLSGASNLPHSNLSGSDTSSNQNSPLTMTRHQQMPIHTTPSNYHQPTVSRMPPQQLYSQGPYSPMPKNYREPPVINSPRNHIAQQPPYAHKNVPITNMPINNMPNNPMPINNITTNNNIKATSNGIMPANSINNITNINNINNINNIIPSNNVVIMPNNDAGGVKAIVRPPPPQNQNQQQQQQQQQWNNGGVFQNYNQMQGYQQTPTYPVNPAFAQYSQHYQPSSGFDSAHYQQHPQHQQQHHQHHQLQHQQHQQELRLKIQNGPPNTQPLQSPSRPRINFNPEMQHQMDPNYQKHYQHPNNNLQASAINNTPALNTINNSLNSGQNVINAQNSIVSTQNNVINTQNNAINGVNAANGNGGVKYEQKGIIYPLRPTQIPTTSQIQYPTQTTPHSAGIRSMYDYPPNNSLSVPTTPNLNPNGVHLSRGNSSASLQNKNMPPVGQPLRSSQSNDKLVALNPPFSDPRKMAANHIANTNNRSQESSFDMESKQMIPINNPDIPLAGAVFALAEDLRCTEDIDKSQIIAAIEFHGGEICMTPFVTGAQINHIVCMHIQHNLVESLSLTAKRKCVTLQYVNDVMECKAMVPPFKYSHLPSFCVDKSFAKEHIFIAIHGFNADESSEIRHMLRVIGSSFSSYIAEGCNGVICKSYDPDFSEKVEKEEVRPLSLKWLLDVYFGISEGVETLFDPKYHISSQTKPAEWTVSKVQLEMLNENTKSMMMPWRVDMFVNKLDIPKIKEIKKSVGETTALNLTNNVLLYSDGVPNEEQIELSRIVFTKGATQTNLICFSGFSDPQLCILSKKALFLGNTITKDIFECTHLVMPSIARNYDLCVGIARGIHIISHEWITYSYIALTMLPEHCFVLDTKQPQKDYCFNLKGSLIMARARQVLDGVTIHLSQNVYPSLRLLARLVVLLGGTFEQQIPDINRIKECHDNKIPLLMLVSEYDLINYFGHLQCDIPIFNYEYLLAVCLTQDLVDLEPFKYSLSNPSQWTGPPASKEGKGEIKEKPEKEAPEKKQVISAKRKMQEASKKLAKAEAAKISNEIIQKHVDKMQH